MLITGASGGLGQALCRSFLEERMCIALHIHKNRRKGDALLKMLEAAGCEALLLPADLCDVKAVQEMFLEIESRWGGLELMIQCAGVRKDRLFKGIDPADWDAVVALNLSAAFFCMQAAARLMSPGKGGHIINIASHSALTGRTGQAAYTASKYGLIALSREAAREWAGASIQVNAVCPGFLPTGMTGALSGKQKVQFQEENLLKRLSTLEEVSDFIRHLSKMEHVSGQVFHLDSRLV